MQGIRLSNSMLTCSWFYVSASPLKHVRYSNNKLSDKNKTFFVCISA